MKKLLRTIKRLADKILGAKVDILFWKLRFAFNKKLPQNYISKESLNHPHRKPLIERIIKYKPRNVLEVGCASGPNLILLAHKLPRADITGLDVSAKATGAGQKYLGHHNIKNVYLKTGNILNLQRFPNKSFDVVFTDATLIYIDKKRIKKVLKELTRISRKTIVLNEWHTNEPASAYHDHWAHNYKKLFEEVAPSANINITKITENVWSGDWSKYGYLIEVKL